MFPELKCHCWAIIIINTIKAKGIPCSNGWLILRLLRWWWVGGGKCEMKKRWMENSEQQRNSGKQHCLSWGRFFFCHSMGIITEKVLSSASLFEKCLWESLSSVVVDSRRDPYHSNPHSCVQQNRKNTIVVARVGGGTFPLHYIIPIITRSVVEWSEVPFNPHVPRETRVVSASFDWISRAVTFNWTLRLSGCRFKECVYVCNGADGSSPCPPTQLSLN